MLDGFPQTREQWTAMADSNMLPDTILSLEESEDSADTLLERFMATLGIADPPIHFSKENEDQPGEKQHKEKEKEVIDINIYLKQYLTLTCTVQVSCSTLNPCLYLVIM